MWAARTGLRSGDARYGVGAWRRPAGRDMQREPRGSATSRLVNLVTPGWCRGGASSRRCATQPAGHERGTTSVKSEPGRRRGGWVGRRNDEKIGPLKGVFALRAYQPFAWRVYPPAADP